MTATTPTLLCALDPTQPASRSACPCRNCRMIVRGIKDDFDVADLDDALRDQRPSSGLAREASALRR